jgi:poly(3-hydroxybutyrate) depolymerase
VATAPENPDVGIETWSPCRAGTAVEFVTIEGASHAWMGHEKIGGSERLSGAPYPHFDSSLAIWTFLAAHPRG